MGRGVVRLVVEEPQKGRLDREEALLVEHAGAIGLPVHRITRKPFAQGRIRPAPGDVVAGTIAFVRQALTALGVATPPQDPYPEVLFPYLHRRVWQADSLGRALATLNRPTFIRPAKRWKCFTGFVAEGPNPAEVYGVSRREPVWCSDVVRFKSEWRCYVVAGEIRFVGLCANTPPTARQYPPDRSVIAEAVGRLAGPSAYAIDFGVLDSGETALIEVNDGFSVGAYDGVAAKDYFDLIATRWQELIGTARERAPSPRDDATGNPSTELPYRPYTPQ